MKPFTVGYRMILRTKTDVGVTRQPLRIWPAFFFISLMILMPMGAKAIENGPSWLWMVSAFGPAVCAVSLLIWWLAASRATARERLIAFGCLLAGLVLAFSGMHSSMHGPAITVVVFPATSSVFAIGVCVADRILRSRRTTVALGAALLVPLFSLTVRTGGLWGDFKQDFDWRWSPSIEEQLMSDFSLGAAGEAGENVRRTAIPDPDDSISEWPGFRGASRDGRQTGRKFASDWNSTPPQLLWKIQVGPGWSSFSHHGGLLFTQEQRGSQESVGCYAAETGTKVWTSSWEARFDDPLGGPGPRATPTFAEGRLYALGATGILRCLNPVDGSIIWERDIGELAQRQPPMWGFSSSPLVSGQRVIVHAGGADGKATLAFDVATGEPQWSAPGGDDTYSSPHLGSFRGEPLVLMLSNLGLEMLRPSDGKVRLSYPWKHSDHRALQPQFASDDTILLPTGMGGGTRLIRLDSKGGALTAEEVWTSKFLKPDFNDFVLYGDHVYGFDGSVFTCIRLDTGERVWKGGRYGKGQVVLLADSGLLLVMSERGEGVLLRASPEAHEEMAQVPLLSGKTWNHPTIVGDRLFVRNAEEAACYRLPTSEGQTVRPQ